VLIADRFHVSGGEDDAYGEHVLRLPNGYVSYTPPEAARPDWDEGRGRPFTFASLNNPSKLNRSIVARWAEIMRRVPDARMIFKYRGFDQPFLRARLATWFAEDGVAADRLIFEAGGPQAEMLARYKTVDLVLDTWPYSGGATSCEALAMGVPVVTYTGESFAGRHATSHLMNAGFPELIATDWPGYVDLAVALAEDRSRLADLRAAIVTRSPSSPHRDHPRFARDFIQATGDIVDRERAG